jgi:DNA phosphorothioation-associated putative methyltransferase
MTDTAAHRTAIVRGDLSRPTRLTVGLNLLREGEAFFDFGCGRGEDVAGLRKLGFEANGWDPHYRPNEVLRDAEIVNIGYVVNVIADPEDRRETLRRAWGLAGKALVVSARLNAERRTITLGRPHGDGYITGNGTFQRFFNQSELRAWIDSTLGVDCVAAAPGIFIAFREEEDANDFLLRTRRRRHVSVTVSRADRMYDENREVLDDLMGFFSERGRLPIQGELPVLEEKLRESVGSLRRAWSIVEKVSDATDWHKVAAERTSDLLVSLALLKLNRRPNFMALPEPIRYDIRALIGSYKEAIAQADELLFSAGNLELIGKLASGSEVGKRLPTAFYVHESALDALPPTLRVYEGCARWLVGDVEHANIVKLATDKAKVSYLSYPGFSKDPHPVLERATYVRIRDLDVDSRDYSLSANPPILHRKESFVAEDFPGYSKFSRLTKQEERFGLLGVDTQLIGNRDGWQARLDELGLALNGHRVVRRK